MEDNQPTADSSVTPAKPGGLVELPPRYELLGELGRGGMGMVYKARDRETGEVVALKVLKPEIASDTLALERFKNELRLARRITHKNVCRIHEFHRTGSTACISMEYVEGESLRVILDRTGLGLHKAVQAARQICAGLAEAHAQGVVHRDLKPENVMLDRDGQIKVMDFGIARAAGSGLTQAGSLVGTPAYMAPEQATGKPTDHRTDIYSLGLILYEVFTGAPAFQGDTPMAVAFQQVQATPPSPREREPLLSGHLEKIILRCLEKDPAKRFQSVDELEAALVAKPEPELVTRAEASPDEPLKITLPPHLMLWQRSDWGLLALALVGAVVFLVLFDRVLPFSAMELQISGPQAVEKALAVARKLEPGVKAVGYHPIVLEGSGMPGSGNILGGYEQRTVLFGLSETNARLRRESPGWMVELGTESQDKGRLYLSARGDLFGFDVPRKRDVKDNRAPELETVLSAARGHLRDLFQVEVGSVAPTQLRFGGEWSLRWTLPGATDELRYYRMSYGPEGLRSISSWFDSKREEDFRRSGEWEAVRQKLGRGFGPLPAVAATYLLAVLMLVLFFVRRLSQSTSPSALLATSVGTLATAGFALAQHMPEKDPLPLLGGLFLNLVLAYFLVRVSEHYLAGALPTQAGTWLALPRERLKARAAGLSLTRGCALGMCYLGAHLLLIYVLSQGKLAGLYVVWPKMGSINLLAQFAVCVGIMTTGVGAWIFLAFPASLAYRASRKAWALMAVTVGLWLLTAFSLPGTGAFPQLAAHLVAGLQGLFFGFILWRYDVLTVVAAMFTVETWLLSYPVYAVFNKVEFWNSSWGMLLWFFVLLLALSLYLRPQIGAAWRRVAVVFQ